MTSAVLADLAPSGTLRAAINFDNRILATKSAAGEPGGISVELAREVARRLAVPVAFVPYDGAARVVEGLDAAAWDICFLAIDPRRAEKIAFTPPYVVIEGAYLVPEASPIRDNADVDRGGVRVAVSAGSAYDLHLSRSLKHATIVRATTAKEVLPMFLAQKLEVAAGVRPMLEADARAIPGLRMLPGRFMAIEQALGTPRGRDAGARWLAEFVEETKASGFVAESLARNRAAGAAVAPAGRGR
ncbi:MAG TPA: ABC transporter substrate-binding protein [Casimicrobiaceae bacterium]|nr:ABC transporter substrate-binding protein [Casimicrobiaceae bacterium]